MVIGNRPAWESFFVSSIPHLYRSDRLHQRRHLRSSGGRMVTAIALLILSAAAIYLSCEYFVNGVEWVGHRFGVSQTATGTVLAAFGTALPESVVTFVAVAFGHSEAQKNIGVGAALGGPLVLATIAYAVVGAVFLTTAHKAERRVVSRPARKRLINDQKWFLAIFVFKLGLGLVAFAFKPWLGILFLLAYAAYVWHEMTAEGEQSDSETLEPLKIRPRDASPSSAWALLQTVGALVAIFLSSQLFVKQIEAIGPWLGMAPQLVALLLSPIATELPETLNAVIWVRQGKSDLALANISGAMMIQATVPSALGIFFTPWMLDHTLIWAGVVTMISVAGLSFFLRQKHLSARKLTAFGGLYGVFALGLFFLK
jgi:cation:H+ antiporter